jgi:hypothetical protein
MQSGFSSIKLGNKEKMDITVRVQIVFVLLKTYFLSNGATQRTIMHMDEVFGMTIKIHPKQRYSRQVLKSQCGPHLLPNPHKFHTHSNKKKQCRGWFTPFIDCK